MCIRKHCLLKMGADGHSMKIGYRSGNEFKRGLNWLREGNPKESR